MTRIRSNRRNTRIDTPFSQPGRSRHYSRHRIYAVRIDPRTLSAETRRRPSRQLRFADSESPLTYTCPPVNAKNTPRQIQKRLYILSFSNSIQIHEVPCRPPSRRLSVSSVSSVATSSLRASRHAVICANLCQSVANPSPSSVSSVANPSSPGLRRPSRRRLRPS